MGMPLKILHVFPLLRRHAVLRDAEGDVWLFQENLENGNYSRYSLRGELLTRASRPKAVVYAALHYQPDPEAIHVFLEDVRTFKPGVGIGTWMVNRVIDVIKRASMVLPIGVVFGMFSPIDEQDPVNKARRDHVFERAGFRRVPVITARGIAEYRIEASPHELRMVHSSHAQAIEELEVANIVREWATERCLRDRR